MESLIGWVGSPGARVHLPGDKAGQSFHNQKAIGPSPHTCFATQAVDAKVERQATMVIDQCPKRATILSAGEVPGS